MDRINRVRERVNGRPILVTNLTNIRYLTGYTGDYAVLLITQDKSTLITDFRYDESSKKEVKGAEIKITKDGLFEELIPLLSNLKHKEIAFESESIKYSTYKKLESSLSSKALIPTTNIVEELRMRKDGEEIKLIKRACEIGDRVMCEIIKRVSPNSTERDIAAEIDYLIKKTGGDKEAFDTIVAFGDNSALPHARPTTRKFSGQNILLIDMGSYYNGYASDMTRTYIIKRGKKVEEMYTIVLEAQKKAINAIKPGVELKEIDRIARDYIRENHYGQSFGHSLGHGVGMVVHELPRVASKSDHTAEEGMIFSIEPGIYVPRFGGVRIEDLVLVTKTRHDILTKTPKSLLDSLLTI